MMKGMSMNLLRMVPYGPVLWGGIASLLLSACGVEVRSAGEKHRTGNYVSWSVMDAGGPVTAGGCVDLGPGFREGAVQIDEHGATLEWERGFDEIAFRLLDRGHLLDYVVADPDFFRSGHGVSLHGETGWHHDYEVDLRGPFCSF